MRSIVGIDSRSFVRDTMKKNGERGHFKSVLGIAVKIQDYEKFHEEYLKAMRYAWNEVGQEPKGDYQYYCNNDLSGFEKKYELMDAFTEKICKHVQKIHVFYTLFSKDRLAKAQVYGRYAKRNKLKLSEPTRTYEDLISEHLIQCFPAICAWRLTRHLDPKTIHFHLDSYQGHIFEGQEHLDEKKYYKFVVPGGDCCDPVISTADLLLDLLDYRLKKQRKLLIFDNIRPVLPEFGENTYVYPILNRDLPFITPIDKVPIDTTSLIKHPTFWVFKGDPIVDSGTLRRSVAFRNLQDYAATMRGCVKLFDKSKDIENFVEGDRGVYFNSLGRESVESYIKLGKPFEPYELDLMVPKEHKPPRKKK